MRYIAMVAAVAGTVVFGALTLGYGSIFAVPFGACALLRTLRTITATIMATAGA